MKTPIELFLQGGTSNNSYYKKLEDKIMSAQMEEGVAKIENGDGSTMHIDFKNKKISVQNYRPLIINDQD